MDEQRGSKRVALVESSIGKESKPISISSVSEGHTLGERYQTVRLNKPVEASQDLTVASNRSHQSYQKQPRFGRVTRGSPSRANRTPIRPLRVNEVAIEYLNENSIAYRVEPNTSTGYQIVITKPQEAIRAGLFHYSQGQPFQLYLDINNHLVITDTTTLNPIDSQTSRQQNSCGGGYNFSNNQNNHSHRQRQSRFMDQIQDQAQIRIAGAPLAHIDSRSVLQTPTEPVPSCPDRQQQSSNMDTFDNDVFGDDIFADQQQPVTPRDMADEDFETLFSPSFFPSNDMVSSTFEAAQLLDSLSSSNPEELAQYQQSPRDQIPAEQEALSSAPQTRRSLNRPGPAQVAPMIQGHGHSRQPQDESAISRNDHSVSLDLSSPNTSASAVRVLQSLRESLRVTESEVEIPETNKGLDLTNIAFGSTQTSSLHDDPLSISSSNDGNRVRVDGDVDSRSSMYRSPSEQHNECSSTSQSVASSGIDHANAARRNTRDPWALMPKDLHAPGFVKVELGVPLGPSYKIIQLAGAFEGTAYAKTYDGKTWPDPKGPFGIQLGFTLPGGVWRNIQVGYRFENPIIAGQFLMANSEKLFWKNYVTRFPMILDTETARHPPAKRTTAVVDKYYLCISSEYKGLVVKGRVCPLELRETSIIPITETTAQAEGAASISMDRKQWIREQLREPRTEIIKIEVKGVMRNVLHTWPDWESLDFSMFQRDEDLIIVDDEDMPSDG